MRGEGVACRVGSEVTRLRAARLDRPHNLSMLRLIMSTLANLTVVQLKQALAIRERIETLERELNEISGGEAAASSVGLGFAVGTAYLLHRTHHYKMERFAVRTMLAVEGGYVANNIWRLY